MLIKELGEDFLIKKIARYFEGSTLKRKGIIKSIGDDAAVVEFRRDKCLLFTTDALVEGIHFKSGYTPPELLGRKSLGISLSDIAAMGGTPLFFLLSIGFPPKTAAAFINEFIMGIKKCADEFNVILIGGNTSSSKKGIVINTVVAGEAEKDEITYRNGAKAQDTIYVSGTVGDSFLGLKLLRENGIEALKGPFGDCALKHLSPTPRVRLGRLISKKKVATSMIDLSDGLIKDLRRITTESGVGAVVEFEKLPLSRSLKNYLKKHPSQKTLPLWGGEDYELLFTAGGDKEKSIKSIQKKLGVNITPIGKILPKGKGLTIVDGHGRPISIKKEGYQHFTETFK